MSLFIGPLTAQNKPPGQDHPCTKADSQPTVQADVDDLKNTIVTVDLQEPIPSDKNVIWCASFQSAWYKLSEFFGGRIILQGDPPLAKALNSGLSTPEDLDPTSTITFSGWFTAAARDQLMAQVKERFGLSDSIRLLPEANNENIVAYAYLRKNMPFKYRFDRSNLPFVFAGTKVASWSYTDSSQNSLALSQAQLLDYKGPNSFVLEFQTRSITDRLILAKIAPEPTLQRTIGKVEKIAASGAKQELDENDMLVVPVLDFNLTEEIRELEGRSILSPASAKGFPLLWAMQRVRFRLDESGALLKSEASMGVGGIDEGIGSVFIFDKPFLVLIQRVGATRPYFAAWIANAELMPPMIMPVSTQATKRLYTINDEVKDRTKAAYNSKTRTLESRVFPMGSTEPLRVLKNVKPEYPPAAQAMGLGGAVCCELIVGKDGRVENARILTSDNAIFNEAALAAVRQWKFSPPTTRTGKRVKVFWIVTIKFSVPKAPAAASTSGASNGR
jgi:TonB family protein